MANPRQRLMNSRPGPWGKDDGAVAGSHPRQHRGAHVGTTPTNADATTTVPALWRDRAVCAPVADTANHVTLQATGGMTVQMAHVDNDGRVYVHQTPEAPVVRHARAGVGMLPNGFNQ